MVMHISIVTELVNFVASCFVRVLLKISFIILCKACLKCPMNIVEVLFELEILTSSNCLNISAAFVFIQNFV